MINTNDDYTNAIKQKLEIEKLGVYGSYFTEPTPAQLRNLCLMFCENGLNGNDENVFKNFFYTKKEEDLKRSITNFEVEKLKPVIHFLKDKTSKTSAVNLELLAILVNFEQRPLVKFLKGEKFSEIKNATKNEEIISFVNVEIEKKAEKTKRTFSKNSLILRILLSIVLLFFSGYFIKKEFFPRKECMLWQIDHYIPINCDAEKIGFASINDVMILEAHLLNFKKVEVNKKTIFFKNEKPLIWYCKKNNKLDFFNASGFHPENGKPLKPITQYMINKWVKD